MALASGQLVDRRIRSLQTAFWLWPLALVAWLALAPAWRPVPVTLWALAVIAAKLRLISLRCPSCQHLFGHDNNFSVFTGYLNIKMHYAQCKTCGHTL
jgi:hypothetical protein